MKTGGLRSRNQALWRRHRNAAQLLGSDNFVGRGESNGISNDISRSFMKYVITTSSDAAPRNDGNQSSSYIPTSNMHRDDWGKASTTAYFSVQPVVTPIPLRCSNSVSGRMSPYVNLVYEWNVRCTSIRDFLLCLTYLLLWRVRLTTRAVSLTILSFSSPSRWRRTDDADIVTCIK